MEQTPQFYDIFEYHYPPFWQTTPFIIFAILTTLLIAGLILAFIFYKRRVYVTPFEWALTIIKALKKEKRISQKDYKKLYYDLTTTIKSYLNKQFSWKTIDKTDEELINYLTLQGIDQELLKQFAALMNGASRIKFANQDALDTHAQEDIASAERLIKTMKSLYDKQQEQRDSTS